MIRAQVEQKLHQVPHTINVYHHLPAVAHQQHLPATIAM